MKPLSLLLALGCVLSAAIGQRLGTATQLVASVRPGFDPNTVARQVHSAGSNPRTREPSVPVLDDGEFLIDTSAALVPAPNDQSEPAVAFDGANFLVVWRDNRSGGSDIYGARVTPQGTVLDSAGFVVSQAADSQRSPALAFDGSNFLVVWEDYRGGSAYIYGARVTSQGTVLDSAGFVVSQAADSQRSPVLAFDGANFLVAWQEYHSGSYYDIYGARVTPQGAVLDSAGIVISQAAHDQCTPSIGFDGTNFLAVWQDCRSEPYGDIYGARVTPAGVVIDIAGVAVSTAVSTQEYPVLAFDGANFLVVWQDRRGGSDYNIYGTRVTPQGAVFDSAGFVISQAAHDQCTPSVGFDSANFLVAWEDDRNGVSDLYGARVTPAGEVLDTAGIVVSAAVDSQQVPALAFDGTNFLVAWQDRRSGSDGDIYGARVTPEGTVPDSADLVISQAVNDQYRPAAGYDGTNFLVVWQDYRGGGGWDIYGARVTPQGSVLDPAGFVISQATDSQCSPALAFDGANFLVVWQDSRGGGADIYGARVTPQGAVLDSAGIVISHAANDQWSPAVGFDGANFLVVWQDDRSDISYWDIYGARVTPQGTVLDPAGLPISTTASQQWTPALAFDGANFLVVWQEAHSGSICDIYGARVTPQGTVLDPSGFVISQAPYNQCYPALAFDGANSLVVWQDYRSGSNFDIYGARVTPAGAVLDTAGIAVCTGTGHQAMPAIAFDGANSLVVWQDYRSGTDCDIYGARVMPGGTVFGGGSVVSQQGYQVCPRLCCGSGGQMLLVYQGWASTVGGKGYKTYRIWGKVNPNPGIEESYKPQATSSEPLPTIVRRMLFLPEAASPKPQAASLLDISGRKVMNLRAGANDVRALAPGVYFVREALAPAQARTIRKVVITR